MDRFSEPNSCGEFQSMVGQDKMIIVECFSLTASACQKTSPVLNLQAEHHPDILFVRLDAQRIGIKRVLERLRTVSFPTYLCYKRGVKKNRFQVEDRKDPEGIADLFGLLELFIDHVRKL